ncbi:amphi-Trp domain-containing protein [Streptomyces sp. NPDC058739]|uniref:amphi-Trp domain-containing protein n=1 Tax=Streptomyces sp. NPDC058739 TaxID=3346618 RepID=UPI00368CDB6E
MAKDLSFEWKNSLSRQEAADRLSALADALREGGEAELELGSGVVSLRFPDKLRTEVEVEVGDGEIELEIELKWSTARPSATAPAAEAGPAEGSRPAPRTTARTARSKKSVSPEKPKRTPARRG